MQAHFGTSGFSYKEWRGSFYPEKLAADAMLSFYATKLPTVELNNSFYRMPRVELVRSWTAAVPEGFRFALKAPRRITHLKKLRDSAVAVQALFSVSNEFGEFLGPTLFQLPPFLKQDTGLLRSFVQCLPRDRLIAFEFRHTSWFTEETYQVLSDHSIAVCSGDLDKLDRAPPLVETADYGYLRLRRSAYSDDDLDEWAQRLQRHAFHRVFGYFKHESLGPALAERMNQPPPRQ